MKTIRVVCCFSVMLIVALTVPPQHGTTKASFALDQTLDTYGNICWEYEKSRLDNFAIELSQDSNWVGYIIVYAGRRSCESEVEARALRARRWVVKKRGVDADKVRWKNGGYREEATTTLLIAPPEMTDVPITPTLASGEAEVIQGCKGKIYNPQKCDE